MKKGKNTENLESMWKKFISTGDLDENVKPYIAESWIRSRDSGVDFQNGVATKLSEAELTEVRKNNKTLISIAVPIMHRILDTVHSIGLVSLTNEQGYILEIFTKDSLQKNLKRINLTIGAKWVEEEIGTNAVSLSILNRRPIMTQGAEHYCRTHHYGICAAAPIIDDDHKVIGCINISSAYCTDESNVLCIVSVAAVAIERQLTIMRSYELIDKTINASLDGVIVTDDELNIINVNKMACAILSLSEKDLKGINICSIAEDIADLKSEMLRGSKSKKKAQVPITDDLYFRINGKQERCRTQLDTIQVNDKIDNFVITISKDKTVNKVVNQIAGNIAVYTFNDIITCNQEMTKTIRFAQRISKNNSSVLIIGESGTGKELFAQAIHNESNRAKGPFVAINCAAIPRDLVESELFGYEKGSFTGALNEGRPGKFELANGGTIFLDEIGEMPMEIQPKLLRVLDSNRITRIGGKHEKNLDIRLIAATNRNLSEEVANHKFRSDFYYRLNVILISIPPLRRRKDDIAILCKEFLRKLNIENQKYVEGISEHVLDEMRKYNWDGNIRQLQNLVAKLFYYCEGNIIDSDAWSDVMQYSDINRGFQQFDESVSSISNESDMASVAQNDISTDNAIDDAYKKIMVQTIIKNNGNITKSARDLKIGKSTIYRKIAKYNIDPKILLR